MVYVSRWLTSRLTWLQSNSCSIVNLMTLKHNLIHVRKLCCRQYHNILSVYSHCHNFFTWHTLSLVPRPFLYGRDERGKNNSTATWTHELIDSCEATTINKFIVPHFTVTSPFHTFTRSFTHDSHLLDIRVFPSLSYSPDPPSPLLSLPAYTGRVFEPNYHTLESTHFHHSSSADQTGHMEKQMEMEPETENRNGSATS